MDKATAKAIQDDLAKAIVDVAQKYGLRITKNHVSYTDTDVQLSFGFQVKDEMALRRKARQDWDDYCHQVHMAPEHLGQEFNVAGRIFIITGLDLGRKRYPITAVAKDNGKQYKFNHITVLGLLRRES